MRVPADRVAVTGSLKFDAAPTQVPSVDNFKLCLGLGDEPILVAGSTGPGEEAMILDAFDLVRQNRPDVRLVIVPRHPPRFEDVATLIRQRCRLTRRSTAEVEPDGVVLIDTMGELRLAWAMATVAIIGRTLVDLGPRQHGSDLIEPAAMGKPIITGPYFGNFDQPTRLLRDAGALAEATNAASLAARSLEFVQNSQRATKAGRAAQRVVDEQRGATARTMELLLPLLPTSHVS